MHSTGTHRTDANVFIFPDGKTEGEGGRAGFVQLQRQVDIRGSARAWNPWLPVLCSHSCLAALATVFHILEQWERNTKKKKKKVWFCACVHVVYVASAGYGLWQTFWDLLRSEIRCPSLPVLQAVLNRQFYLNRCNHMLWITIELAAPHVILLCVIEMLRKKSWTVWAFGNDHSNQNSGNNSYLQTYRKRKLMMVYFPGFPIFPSSCAVLKSTLQAQKASVTQQLRSPNIYN